MFTGTGYASTSAEASLASLSFRHPDAGPCDIAIACCGVCHSDLRKARNERPNTLLRGVPGRSSRAPPGAQVFRVIRRCRDFGDALTGGIAAMQEMFDACVAHGIISDMAMIPVDAIEAAYGRMLGKTPERTASSSPRRRMPRPRRFPAGVRRLASGITACPAAPRHGR